MIISINYFFYCFFKIHLKLFLYKLIFHNILPLSYLCIKYIISFFNCQAFFIKNFQKFLNL
nr:MAG TPA: hypothetical protein [Caudoviricetes sp.]